MSTLNATNLKNPSSGSNNIVLGTDGSTTIPTLSATTITGTSVRGGITSGTSVASTSDTSIDFTSIPSWVKRVTVTLSGVSTTGTNVPLIQLGDSGGIETASYVSHTAAPSSNIIDTTRGGSSTDGVRLAINGHAAADLITGNIVFVNITGNTWIVSGAFLTSSTFVTTVVGSKTLSATLDRVRITTNSADTFDAGTVNILYEG